MVLGSWNPKLPLLGWALSFVVLSAHAHPLHGRPVPWSKALPTRPGVSVRARLLRIRDIAPKPGLELINDSWYLGVVRDRTEIASGLLACVGDSTRITSPYSEPSTTRFTLGDLAFSILCDLELVDYDAVTAPLVGEAAMKAQGRFALDEWLQSPGHRAALQRAAKSWYRSHPPRTDGWWNLKR